ncbi:hypothetical protein [Garciella nitratireducens]|uniref:Uncharacterized protein n=1 Tax=Garciella nitratireducens DSM 15102 TaxID=1121911 RepID=A0A1T4K7A5_9FIRM|nr:hypothetical protein [Garciella nitratireducens]SJZ38193.1 hypothetical protein SAMN02745973_00385 [Garciella nitratireducens DSM 15102]
MNRQQRRKAKKQNKKKITYWKAKGAMLNMVDVYNAAVALVLRDKHRFGKERMTKFFNDIGTVLEDMDNDLISIKDIQETLKEEIDFDLTK